MDKKKMLPVGIENFEKIRTSDFYYVDKTGLIKELLHKWSEVNLITRPRRFGKSLNMSMLRYFFEIGTDAALFQGLKISDDTALCQEYMGKFPVISISLKGTGGADFSQAKALLTNVICAEVRRHSYLMQSDKLDKYDKVELETLLLKEISEGTIENSLLVLSRMLHKHYNKKVIILIDEYDVPLAKANDYGYYEEMVILIRGIFEQALKTNESLQFSVLTGYLRVSGDYNRQESIFTGLNNPKILSITSVKFDEYFGFTDQEVQELLAYYGLETRYQTVKKWYDGYKFGDVHVYCPWDVINYVDDLRENPKMRPQNYWTNTSSNDIIRKFLDKADDTTKWEIEQLIAGEAIEKEIYQELTYAELDKSINHLWSVLFTTGYLTYQQLIEPGEEEIDEGSDRKAEMLMLRIPNEEIRSIFKNQIYKWFHDYVKKDMTRYGIFSDAFVDGNADTVQKMFNQYLMETISIRDTSVKKEMKENFYHGILLGMLKYREDWLIKSNQESGEGFNDITIECKAKRIGVVIEVKYAENDKLDAECTKAINQINEKNYVTILKEHQIEKILKYGIACYKKHCKVVMEEEPIDEI